MVVVQRSMFCCLQKKKQVIHVEKIYSQHLLSRLLCSLNILFAQIREPGPTVSDADKWLAKVVLELQYLNSQNSVLPECCGLELAQPLKANYQAKLATLKKRRL